LTSISISIFDFDLDVDLDLHLDVDFDLHLDVDLKGRGFSRAARAASPSALAAEGKLFVRRGVDISATLCMSPCSSDYIFSNHLSKKRSLESGI
jgi:hypothetical protein